MGKIKKESIESVLKKIGKSARRQAFRNNRPVAISENGKAILLYPDGSKKEVTATVLKELAANVHP